MNHQKGMNLPIKKTWGPLTSLTAAVATLAFASPAMAASATPPTPVAPLPMEQCIHPETEQSLLSFGDLNQFFLAPGGTFDDLTGWELTGGASIVSTLQPDGTTGSVLDLPQGAQAASPPLCITVDYPMARLWARGLADSEDIDFNVVYLKNGEWTKPKNTGHFKGDKKGWTLSKEMKIDPEKYDGWQQVRFVLFTDAKSSVQVDNFWVDPRASR